MMGEAWSLYFVFVLVCAVGLVLTLAGEYHARTFPTAAGKLIAASAYVGAALSIGALESRYGRFLLGGMACCWLGDLFLVSRNSRPLFTAGLAAFLLGHLVYVAAFVVRGVSEIAVIIAAVPMFVIALLVARWLKPYLDGRMRLPVHFYIAAITAMLIIAVGTFHAQGGWCLIAGAALFFVSDLGVARNRFVAPGFINRAWGLPVYFAAQMLLAASVAI